MSEGKLHWSLATTALKLLHADTSLKGLLVSAAYGPVQQAFINDSDDLFKLTRIPVSVSRERLLGALDINQTLSTGKPVFQRGLLDTDNGGAFLINGAERLETLTQSVLTAHIDKPDTNDNVFIVMDESTEDEPGFALSAMADRLAMMIELPALKLADLQALPSSANDHSLDKPLALPVGDVSLSDDMLSEIATLAQRLGVDSVRALLYAVRVARVHAAINNRSSVSVDDAAVAAQLVLAPRATAFESGAEEAADESQQPPDNKESNDPPPEDDQPADSETDPTDSDDNEQMSQTEDIGERLLEAAAATLPQHLIADLVRGQKNNRSAGRDANAAGHGSHGRPVGVRRPRGGIRGQRLNIIETLKSAAPKQRLRGNIPGSNKRLQVRLEDFRITRYKQPTRTTTVFVVDASGSAALHRLAEAKGAIELLLAECYVRRDRVAMISFRGSDARLALSPTRSLVRAKRELAGMPGGGGTPLAAGLDLATQVVQQLKQAGETPVVVIMTDGKANIARNGEASRAAATEDAHNAARQLAATNVKCLFIDTAPRARPQARELAAAMQASYLPLPSGNTNSLPELIRG